MQPPSLENKKFLQRRGKLGPKVDYVLTNKVFNTAKIIKKAKLVSHTKKMPQKSLF